MEKSKARNILITACFSFFSFGLLWAAIGPLLSQFAVRNHTTLATIGGIYSGIFLGAVFALLVLGPLTDRWGHLRSLTLALLTLALGIVGVSLSSWLPLTFFLAFIAGLGQGITNLSGNVMVGRLFPEKNVAAVNLVNLFFGLGAFVGPLFVSLSLHLWQNGFPALWFSAFLLLAAVALFLFGFFNVKVDSSNLQKTGQPKKKLHVTAFLFSLGMLILLYVGSESAIGGWATSYMQQTTSLKIEIAALAASGFWLALSLGRAMGTLIGTRLSARHVLMICLAIASLGTFLFVAGYGQTVMSMAAIFLIGLGFGAIYPTGMAMLTSAHPDNPGQAGSLITAMASIGGVIIPWLQGVVMEKTSIRGGTYMVAVLMLLLILSFAVNQWAVKRVKNN